MEQDEHKAILFWQHYHFIWHTCIFSADGADLFGGGLVGGLMGRAVGSLLGGALNELRDVADQVADVQGRAAAAIEGSNVVLARLGSVRCLPAVSQSSMTQTINGQTTRTVTLIMPVAGSGGYQVATAEVRYIQNAVNMDLEIVLALPNGERLQVDEGGGGGSGSAGRTIDVEWKEL
jgi:hypothetical protein